MPDTPPRATLDDISAEIVSCNKCERLRSYCLDIARVKRKAFRNEIYWGRPVPGGGDPSAQIVVVGLAPAAHGANRTGRNFTGDGAGGSGDFLMTALHANGLANQTFSRSKDDGLTLSNVWITAAVRCAPPNNKPTPAETANCETYLRAEMAALTRATVQVALGRIAFDACWRLVAERLGAPVPKPTFEHGAVYRYSGGPTLVASYHPSRQNTQTGRLTPAMLRDVFKDAVRAATSSSGDRRASTDRRTPRPTP